MGDAVIFHGVCDHIGTGTHLRQGIAHCHADTGQLQHFQIVVGISKGNGFLRGDTDCRTQGTDTVFLAAGSAHQIHHSIPPALCPAMGHLPQQFFFLLLVHEGDDLIYAAVFQIGDVTHSRHGGADFCLLDLHAGVHTVGVHPVFFKKNAAAVLFL